MVTGRKVGIATSVQISRCLCDALLRLGRLVDYLEWTRKQCDDGRVVDAVHRSSKLKS